MVERKPSICILGHYELASGRTLQSSIICLGRVEGPAPIIFKTSDLPLYAEGGTKGRKTKREAAGGAHTGRGRRVG